MTQDNENNVYVLTETFLSGNYDYHVMRFSGTGEYLATFALDNTIYLRSEQNAVRGIVFNPNFPNELMLLFKRAAGDYVIRSVAKQSDDKAVLF